VNVDKATVSIGLAASAFVAMGGALVWVGGKGEAIDAHLNKDYPKLERRIDKMEDRLDRIGDQQIENTTILKGIAGALGVPVPTDAHNHHNGGPHE